MLTLRELKNMAETAPSGQKTPTARELRSSGKLIAERKIGESAGIAACWNGYAVYYAGRAQGEVPDGEKTGTWRLQP